MQLGTNADKKMGFVGSAKINIIVIIDYRVGSFFAGDKTDFSDLYTVLFC